MVSIKRPCLNFPKKVFIKRPGLSQVLRASVHENQGFSIFFEKVFIKQQFQIPEVLTTKSYNTVFEFYFSIRRISRKLTGKSIFHYFMENQFSYKSNKNTSLFSFESVFEVHY